MADLPNKRRKTLHLPVVGAAIAIVGLTISSILAFNGKPLGIFTTAVAVLTIVFLISNRVTEVSFLTGKVKAAKARVVSDANAIRKLRRRLEEHRTAFETKVRAIDNKASEASDFLAFLEAVVGAMLDDRRAFDRLREWSKSIDYRFRLQAEDAFRRTYEMRIEQSDYPSPPTLAIPLSFPDVQEQFKNSISQGRHAALRGLDTTFGATRLEKLDFLATAIRDDPSLKVAKFATRLFHTASCVPVPAGETSKMRSELGKLSCLDFAETVAWFKQYRPEYERTHRSERDANGYK